MAWLRKEKGGSSIGPHEWPEDGSVCEVPDELAADLLADPDWGYAKADPPKPKPRKTQAPAGESTGNATGTA